MIEYDPEKMISRDPRTIIGRLDHDLEENIKNDPDLYSINKELCAVGGMNGTLERVFEKRTIKSFMRSNKLGFFLAGFAYVCSVYASDLVGFANFPGEMNAICYKGERLEAALCLTYLRKEIVRTSFWDIVLFVPGPKETQSTSAGMVIDSSEKSYK